MYDSLFSPGSVLNEQVARQVFEILPERGPIVVIIDRDQHLLPSDSQRFSSLNISESFLRQLQAKIDDGSEPVVTELNDCTVVAAQLITDRTNCGYVMILLPKYSTESALANFDLIETILGQITVIARLIEKNSALYELQVKHFSGQAQNPTSAN